MPYKQGQTIQALSYQKPQEKIKQILQKKLLVWEKKAQK